MSEYAFMNLWSVLIWLIGNGAQTTDMSWWPRHSAWLSSGLNIGVWTSACEEWFLTHRQKIMSGQEGPRSATDWKKRIKFSHRLSSVIIANTNAVADSVIHNVSSN